MKGQVFTIAKLHYVNGVVYYIAENGAVSLQEVADNFETTTPSGNVKHPRTRVKTLARFAEGLGLLRIEIDDVFRITELGKEYYRERDSEKWILSKKQKQILTENSHCSEDRPDLRPCSEIPYWL